VFLTETKVVADVYIVRWYPESDQHLIVSIATLRRTKENGDQVKNEST
jgi:hypothetical protein